MSSVTSVGGALTVVVVCIGSSRPRNGLILLIIVGEGEVDLSYDSRSLEVAAEASVGVEGNG